MWCEWKTFKYFFGKNLHSKLGARVSFGEINNGADANKRTQIIVNSDTYMHLGGQITQNIVWNYSPYIHTIHIFHYGILHTGRAATAMVRQPEQRENNKFTDFIYGSQFLAFSFFVAIRYTSLPVHAVRTHFRYFPSNCNLLLFFVFG